jgi:hypothetical protein
MQLQYYGASAAAVVFNPSECFLFWHQIDMSAHQTSHSPFIPSMEKSFVPSFRRADEPAGL